LLRLVTYSQVSLEAGVLFLCKHLGFYQKRKIEPHRFNDSARLSMLFLAKLFRLEKRLGEREAGNVHRLA